MKMPLKKAFFPNSPRLFQWVALALLIATGALTIWQLGNFMKTAVWVKQNYDTILVSAEMQSAVRAAESNARGYRVFKDPQFVSGFQQMHAESLRKMEELKKRNPAPNQADDLDRLGALVIERLAVLDRRLTLQLSQGEGALDSAEDLAEGGVKLMTRIERHVHDYDMSIRADLDQRLGRLYGDTRILLILIGAGVLIAIAMLLVFQRGLSRETARARELEKQAREALLLAETANTELAESSSLRQQLNEYGSILQGCQSQQEAMDATRTLLEIVVPGIGGHVYNFRSSQNLAEDLITYGKPHVESNDLIAPDQCWAMRQGRMHATGADLLQPRCGHLMPDAGSNSGGHTLCIPLAAQGVMSGLLYASSETEIPANHREVLLRVSEQLSQAVANLKLRESLRLQSLRDELTGLYNRRYLEANLNREIQRCQRRNLPLSVLMVDVDHFKTFNDQYGHAAGDALLSALGRTMEQNVREEDIACRYGGEEFTVVLPEADTEEAARTAERLRVAIASLTVQHMRKTYGPATISIGIATMPEHGSSPDALLAAADRALYQAKAAGRNRYLVAERG